MTPGIGHLEMDKFKSFAKKMNFIRCTIFNDCFVSDDPSSALKSTRHIPSDGGFYGYNPIGTGSDGLYPPHLVTPVSTITVFGLIGDFCISDADCQVPNSVCGTKTKRSQP